MKSVYDIVKELNADNGTNYKMDVLRKYKDNQLLQRVLKMTYDKVDFTYGISMKNIDPMYGTPAFERTLEMALDILETEFVTRNTTGNNAIALLEDVLRNLHAEDAHIVKGVINRDLRINMGRSNINKVFKGLIVKPVYMRCGLFKKGKSKIDPEGSFIQLKADGTYREFTMEHGDVTSISRSGEGYEYPVHYDIMKAAEFPDGHYVGELTVWKDGKLLDRATGNGLINSDNPPHDDIVLELWDYITLEEYTGAANKVKGTTPYHERFARVNDICAAVEPRNDVLQIRPILSYEVNTVAEALQRCGEWMAYGYEGAIWKDRDAIFRDGTSLQQEKMKLEIDADVRITGFKPGTIGTKREGKIGSIEFATDDGKVKGFASGFSDEQLDDFDSRREEILGMIMAVKFNDITQARGNDFFALSHPRFVELRDDKNETDTLERILESKEMAMGMGG